MVPALNPSKNQIDRLGDRLRKGSIYDDDLRLLDSYRRSFTEAYELVIGQIRNQLNLEPTGRPAKSTTSIIDKLQRESIRLSQMQDIAGCRIVVADLLTQDEVVERLTDLFDRATIVDRREDPSHGYRAVHVQIRTLLQHLWAELSEKLSDSVDSAIKYGHGDKEVVAILSVISQRIRDQELAESRHVGMMASHDLEEDDEYREGMSLPVIMGGRVAIVRMLDAIGEVIPRVRGSRDDLSD